MIRKLVGSAGSESPTSPLEQTRPGTAFLVLSKLSPYIFRRKLSFFYSNKAMAASLAWPTASSIHVVIADACKKSATVI